MSYPTDDADVIAWVTARLRALDTTPRDKRWRTKAVGMPMSVALAQAPREYRLDLNIAVAEMRVLRDAAAARGIPVRSYAKRAMATMMAVDGHDTDLYPALIGDGLMGPR